MEFSGVYMVLNDLGKFIQLILIITLLNSFFPVCTVYFFNYIK